MENADNTTNRGNPVEQLTRLAQVPRPMPTLPDLAKSFGHRLFLERSKMRLSLRALQELSDVPNSHISAMEQGKRRCGARAAQKLAEVFWPTSDKEWPGQQHALQEKQEFLYAAAATIRARGVVEDAALYPPEILDGVGFKLRQAGIRDKDIESAGFDVTKRDGQHVDLVVQLRDRRIFDITIMLNERKG